MGVYECRHPEWHDDTDWHEVKAFDAQTAATLYAEYLDSRDSETFMDPSADPVPVLVREFRRPDTMALFAISFDYCKSFHARRQRIADLQTTIGT